MQKKSVVDDVWCKNISVINLVWIEYEDEWKSTYCIWMI